MADGAAHIDIAAGDERDADAAAQRQREGVAVRDDGQRHQLKLQPRNAVIVSRCSFVGTSIAAWDGNNDGEQGAEWQLEVADSNFSHFAERHALQLDTAGEIGRPTSVCAAASCTTMRTRE